MTLSAPTILTAGLGIAAAMSLASPAHAVNLLNNPGFEDADTSGGDVSGAPGWGQFNDAFSSSMSAPAFEGDDVLKIFGPFGTGGGAGVFQNFGAASPGDEFEAKVQAQNWSSDPIQGLNRAVIKLEFLDGSGVIGAVESLPINASTPQDTWTELSVTGVAPAGTVSAQVVLVHVQENDPVTGGSVFFDAASVELVPEPTSLALLTLGGLLVSRRRRNG